MKIKIQDKKVVDIDTLSFVELSQLNNKIKKKMNEKTPLVEVLKEINILNFEIEKMRNLVSKIKENDRTHAELEKLGFNIITYSSDLNHIGFINCNKEKKNEEHYCIEYFFDTKELVNRKHNPVSDDDVAKIKTILEKGVEDEK